MCPIIELHSFLTVIGNVFSINKNITKHWFNAKKIILIRIIGLHYYITEANAGVLRVGA